MPDASFSQPLYDGIDKLYKGFLLAVIAYLILVVGVIIGVLSAWALIGHGDTVSAVWATASSAVAAVIVGVVLGVVSFVFVVEGFNVLGSVKEGYRVGYRGSQLIIAALVVLVLAVAAIVAMPHAFPVFIALAAVAGLLALAGYIMVTIALWRLGEDYDSTLLKVGAILWVVGLLASVSGFGGLLMVVGVVLVVLGLREVRSRIAPSQPVEPGPRPIP